MAARRAAVANEKPHLSPSQIDMYCRCPEQWRRRYVENEICPPGVSMLQGGGVHVGIETNNRQKIESHEDLPAADIVDAAVAGFEDRLQHEGYELSRDELSRGASIVIGEAKDSVATLADVYARESAPEYQPVYVEQYVRIELPNSERDLLGYIDCADERKIVTDWKTSKRKKPQADAAKSLQLTTYAAAYFTLTGEPAEEVRLDVLINTKKPGRQVLSDTRGPRDFEVLANTMNAVQAGIRAGVFPPSTNGWWCSPDYCGYHASCPYVNHEKLVTIDLGANS